LNVMASLMNDRTGRLFKSLVLEQQVANQAFARQDSRKYEGFLEFRGIAKPGKAPEDVEKGIYKELEKLQTELVPDHELGKVKNNLAASNFRGKQSDFNLLINILINDASRSWRSLNTDPPLLQAVTAADVQRVAKKYLKAENRNVLILYRKGAN
jgi:zinc protease